LTFGSTCHLTHHVDPSIPGAYLHTTYALSLTQKRLGVPFKIRSGDLEFLKCILRQFQGPKLIEELDASWILLATSPTNSKAHEQA
ncbi:MAG: hypothetical protein MN733_02100, partial [Nitrososphaera sp.]|nr:hypothetical protein [Nitrososphaera sp.]